MFERFTERARQAIVLAQEEARDLKHNYIGTEHILAGLVRENEGIAARVLDQYISAKQVRSHILKIVGAGEEATPGQIPFTPRSKKVLEMALREALSLGHNYIGTEHILLAFLREGEGIGARILLDHCFTLEDIRDETIGLLSGAKTKREKAEARDTQWAQHKTEEETSKESSQESSESSQEKEAVTITYGGWTLKIEGDISGRASTQIVQLLDLASTMFQK